MPTRHDPAELDQSLHYRLHPQVALRPEPFGSLAYHYGNRRLVFLRSQELVELVRALDGRKSLREHLAPVAPERQPALLRALGSLAGSELITPVEAGS